MKNNLIRKTMFEPDLKYIKKIYIDKAFGNTAMWTCFVNGGCL